MEKQHSKMLKKLAKEGGDTEQKQNQLKRELEELLAKQDVQVISSQEHSFILEGCSSICDKLF